VIGRNGGGVPAVDLIALASAAPPHRITQREVLENARPYLVGHERLLSAFEHAGVDERRTVRPLEWYREERDWAQRTEIYDVEALELLTQASSRCLAAAGVDARDVDAIVAVTSTGVSVPSLDVAVARRLGFRPDVERTPIFGLGCSGGVSGIARAADVARSRPGRIVLFGVVEPCSIHLSLRGMRASDVISLALFGDGACAALLRCSPVPGSSDGFRSCARVGHAGEDLWPDTGSLAGIAVRRGALAPTLSPDLPRVLRERIGASVDGFLASAGMRRSDLAGYILHAGASKLLDVQVEELGITRDAVADSYEVLRTHGNVSAASATLVLERTISRGARGLHLVAAPGPGLTLSYVLVELGEPAATPG
jgi:alkylresorcinol/alkylpyrone synthase